MLSSQRFWSYRKKIVRNTLQRYRLVSKKSPAKSMSSQDKTLRKADV